MGVASYQPAHLKTAKPQSISADSEASFDTLTVLLFLTPADTVRHTTRYNKKEEKGDVVNMSFFFHLGNSRSLPAATATTSLDPAEVRFYQLGYLTVTMPSLQMHPSQPNPSKCCKCNAPSVFPQASPRPSFWYHVSQRPKNAIANAQTHQP